MAEKKQLQGQVAIITGGSRGLGRSIAEWLAAAGAAVVVTARNAAQVQAAADALTQSGARALGLPADVGDQAQVEAVVAHTLDEFGRIDILINNAALALPIAEVSQANAAEWAYNIQVNLVGPFYLAHSVLPTMMEQRSGRIINVSSGLSSAILAGFSAYSASKAGLDQLTRILALEVKGRGITVNSVYPGMVDTEMQAEIRRVDTGEAGESVIDLSLFRNAPQAGHLISAHEAAKRIYWLCGPWSGQRTGEIFTFRDEAWLAQVEQEIHL
jgi:NAD(P)-dependent dehydrogenase (short-subunit alcohol dehydrogenase family)